MRNFLLSGITFFSLFSGNAFACPDRQYEVCALICICVPNSAEVIDTIPGASQAGAEAGGTVLAEWIRTTRNNSIGSAAPIPWQVRGALSGFIDDSTLNRARYKVGDTGVLSLAGLSMQYGDPAAITLDDLIVFRDGRDLNIQISLWAHELTHVHQYEKWGVHSFSVQYVRDHATVEAEANDTQNRYPAWLAARRAERINRPPQPGLDVNSAGATRTVGLSSGTILQQCGCYGRVVAMEAVEPRCQSSTVVVSQCPGWCQYQNGTTGAAYGWLCK